MKFSEQKDSPHLQTRTKRLPLSAYNRKTLLWKTGNSSFPPNQVKCVRIMLLELLKIFCFIRYRAGLLDIFEYIFLYAEYFMKVFLPLRLFRWSLMMWIGLGLTKVLQIIRKHKLGLYVLDRFKIGQKKGKDIHKTWFIIFLHYSMHSSSSSLDFHLVLQIFNFLPEYRWMLWAVFYLLTKNEGYHISKFLHVSFFLKISTGI